MKKMKKIGIIGGAGYTGGEAVRILLNHPEVELAFVQSASNAGNLLSDVHTDLLGDTEMRFSAEAMGEDGSLADVLIICAGHGDARKWLEANPVAAGVKIVDLSQDFRLAASSSSGGRRFVYGLPEMSRAKIAAADSIANPGCFATCLQLGMLPLAASGLFLFPRQRRGPRGKQLLPGAVSQHVVGVFANAAKSSLYPPAGPSRAGFSPRSTPTATCRRHRP